MESETLWDRIKKGVLESASTAAEKAEYFGRLGRARLDIAGTRHAIHEAFAELGGQIYGRIQQGDEAGMAQQPEIGSLVQKISDLEGLFLVRKALLDALLGGLEGGPPARGGGAETQA